MNVEIIEGKYAASSGPGPWHLLMKTDDGPKILCGVRRIMLVGSMRELDLNRVCIQCLNRRQKSAKPAPPDAAQTKALIEDAAATLAEVVDARARFSKQMEALRGAHGEHVDGLLKLAHANGYALAELGLMFGLTRERIRQRVADAPEVDR